MDSQKIQVHIHHGGHFEHKVTVEASAEQVTGEEGVKKKLRFKSPAKKRSKRPKNIVINTPSENPKTTNVGGSGRQLNKDVGGSKKRISSARMPCRHAVAALRHMNEKPENHCHGWLTMASLHATYAHHVCPLQGEEFWTKTDTLPPLPPTLRRQPGRPRKQRIRSRHGKSQIKEGNPHKLKRTLADFRCSVCGEVGHTKKTYEIAKRQKLEQEQSAQAEQSTYQNQDQDAAQAAQAEEQDQDAAFDGDQPDEIVITQSQLPPLNSSPQKQPEVNSPPPNNPTDQHDRYPDSMVFMPTPGI